MTTGDHSIWSAHRGGESLRNVGYDLRMTPVTTMGKDLDSGGAQVVFDGKTHGTAENTDASMWRFASKSAVAMITDQLVRSTRRSKATEGNVTGTRMRAESVLPNDRRMALALALIDAAQGRNSEYV